MTRITLTVNGAQAWAAVDGPLTSGMVGLPVTIEYDEVWEGLTKNLVCRCSPWESDSGEIRTILDVVTSATVAPEVMRSGMYLHLGIEGFSADGKLVIPTTWASCGEIQYGANTGGDPSTDPSLPVWNQLQTQIEEIKQDAATQKLHPADKTEDMTQPVGVDQEGRLWTAPTAGSGGAGDILLGTLPMAINESGCYLLSGTNAAISTGEGAAQLVDFDANAPYIGATTYNGGAVEVVDPTTVKISFADVSKNATIYFDVPLSVGKTYTLAARLRERSADVADAAATPLVRATDASGIYAQTVLPASGDFAFKAFDMREGTTFYAQLYTNDSYTVGKTFADIEVRIYEGEHTQIPSGVTFDILAGEKYPTDGYMGATLTALSGGPVQVYKTNAAETEPETDDGGVIFFGDSILDLSDVVARYAARTGKPVLDCAVGGTRMSGSRESTNEYSPYDMTNIANAIASGDFSAQVRGGKNANFTVLASANLPNYKAIVLEFGANDFTAGASFEGEGVTSIQGALRHILRTILTKYPNMRIVVLSTLQYVTIGTGTESGIPTHADGTVWQMNEVIRDVCESDEFCVPWVDMYHAFGQNGITRNTLTGDGVHLAAPNGAKRYADILISRLNGLGI